MKLTVIGTGLIGSQVIKKLTAAGHEVVPASRSTGVDLLTGKGLDRALKGAEVVINLSNSPTFDEACLDFFRTSMRNLLAAGEKAGVRHQVILSIVGVDRVPELAYYRGKTLEEELLRQGPTPYSIVRATQFFEFMNAVLSWTSDDTTVRLPSVRLQPIASADVVDAVVEVSTGTPLRGIWNVAGPDVFALDELGRITLAARHDERTVITDDNAGMFAPVVGDVLTGGADAHLAPTHYRDWLQTSAEEEIRAALTRHWAASAAGDYEVEHEIYEDDVVLDYPQSGERIHGRRNIQASRSEHPAKRQFEIRRISGRGDLWVTEYIIVYDDRPYYTISVMEFSNGRVIHETQYFGEPFAAPAWRSRWAETVTSA